ncbi:MAG TPA: YqaE/Pmp3 family membrane protein [Sphingomonas sp.]|nr:YqaE/Pmp3 family membrane protein [Sphingomonas sp.]
MVRPGIGEVVAAILLPPLGIYLARGLGTEFWVGTLLTILFWIPGVVFALAAVLRPGVLARE